MKLVGEPQHTFVVKALVCKPCNDGHVVDFVSAGLGPLEVLTTIRITGDHARAQFGGPHHPVGVLAVEECWRLQPTPWSAKVCTSTLGYRLQQLGKSAGLSSSDQKLPAWPGATVQPLSRSRSGLFGDCEYDSK